MVKVRTCECCGHPLPKYEVLIDLTPKQQRLFQIVHRAGRAGINYNGIVDMLYADKDGGPSRNILSVMKVRMQPKLAKHGLKLVCRTGPDSHWRVEAIGD